MNLEAQSSTNRNDPPLRNILSFRLTLSGWLRPPGSSRPACFMKTVVNSLAAVTAQCDARHIFQSTLNLN